MSAILTEIIVSRLEQIRLVRRKNIKEWQVHYHYTFDGVKAWFLKSVQTTDLDKAVELAAVRIVKKRIYSAIDTTLFLQPTDKECHATFQ